MHIINIGAQNKKKTTTTYKKKRIQGTKKKNQTDGMVHPNGSFSTQWRRASLATLRRENVQLKREQQIHYGKKRTKTETEKENQSTYTIK